MWKCVLVALQLRNEFAQSGGMVTQQRYIHELNETEGKVCWAVCNSNYEHNRLLNCYVNFEFVSDVPRRMIHTHILM